MKCLPFAIGVGLIVSILVFSSAIPAFAEEIYFQHREGKGDWNWSGYAYNDCYYDSATYLINTGNSNNWENIAFLGGSTTIEDWIDAENQDWMTLFFVCFYDAWFSRDWTLEVQSWAWPANSPQYGGYCTEY